MFKIELTLILLSTNMSAKYWTTALVILMCRVLRTSFAAPGRMKAVQDVVLSTFEN